MVCGFIPSIREPEIEILEVQSKSIQARQAFSVAPATVQWRGPATDWNTCYALAILLRTRVPVLQGIVC